MAEPKPVPEAEVPITREELYKKYEAQQTDTPPAEEEKKEEVADTAPVEAEKSEEKKEEVKEEAHEEPEKETKQQKPHDWKAATYEERAKRQAEIDLRRRAEARAAELEKKIKAYETQQVDEPITDYDRELIGLKNKVKAIEETERERAEREKKETFERVKKELDTNIDKTHEKLLKEGYYGFKRSIDSVHKELMRLVDEDETNVRLDNPEGWERIYKETIFPEIQAEFEAANKQRVIEDKTKLKQSANLASSTGKMPPKPKNPNDMTEAEAREEYFKMRRGG